MRLDGRLSLLFDSAGQPFRFVEDRIVAGVERDLSALPVRAAPGPNHGVREDRRTRPVAALRHPVHMLQRSQQMLLIKRKLHRLTSPVPAPQPVRFPVTLQLAGKGPIS